MTFPKYALRTFQQKKNAGSGQDRSPERVFLPHLTKVCKHVRARVFHRAISSLQVCITVPVCVICISQNLYICDLRTGQSRDLYIAGHAVAKAILFHSVLPDVLASGCLHFHSACHTKLDAHLPNPPNSSSHLRQLRSACYPDHRRHPPSPKGHQWAFTFGAWSHLYRAVVQMSAHIEQVLTATNQCHPRLTNEPPSDHRARVCLSVCREASLTFIL